MGIYDYEHLEGVCKLGKFFGIWGAFQDADLTQCPNCMGPVRRINSTGTAEAQKGNAVPDSLPESGRITQETAHGKSKYVAGTSITSHMRFLER